VNKYSNYQSDVVEEEYGTEPLRPRSSVKRYRQGDYQGAATTPVTQRSSRQRASQSGRVTGGSRTDRITRTQEFSRGETEKLSSGWQQQTMRPGPSRAVKPQRRKSNRQPSALSTWWHQQSTLTHVASGMVAAVIGAVVGWHGVTAWENNYADPMNYTQTAHRDTMTATIEGHHVQIRAFVDASGHLTAVVIPDGNGKPQLFQSPSTVPFAHSMVEVTKTNLGYTVTAHGPFDDSLLPSRPHDVSFLLPLDQQKPQGK